MLFEAVLVLSNPGVGLPNFPGTGNLDYDTMNSANAVKKLACRS
jgi:hypothetical protein